MKKLTTIIAAMAAVLLTGACNKAEVEHEGSAVTLDYTVSLDEVATKAEIGDGTTVDKMVYAVFDGNDQIKKDIVSRQDNKFSFTPSFYYGKTYTVALFAYKEGAYDVDNIKAIKKSNNGEASDAFAHYETIKLNPDGTLEVNRVSNGNATSRIVELTRPVAQLTVATESLVDMTKAGASKIQVKLNAPNSYNAVTGALATAVTANYTSTVAQLGTIEVSGKSYAVVSCDYLFPTVQDVTIEVIKVNPDNTDTVIRTITLNNVPLVANKKTQIYGNLVKGEITFDVSINNVFNQEVTEKPIQQ